MPRTKTASPQPDSSQGESEPRHNVAPELEPYLVEIDTLKLDARNPRLHGDANLDAIARSMEEFGQDQPIVFRAEDRTVIKGNGRLLAAKAKLKWTHVAAIGTDDPKMKAAARAIADNRSSDLAGTDRQLLATLIQSIQDSDADLVGAIGFSAKEIDGLIASIDPGNTRNENELPKTKGRATTKAGDLYELGRHRLLCGDATREDHWAALMGKATAAMAFTDPPYGVAYKSASQAWERIAGDDLEGDELVQRLLAPTFRQIARHTADTAGLYIWHSDHTRADFELAMKMAGLQMRQIIVWAKPQSSLGQQDYRTTHEPCIYASKAGQEPTFYGDRSNFTVWRIGLAGADADAAVIGPGILLLDGQGGRLWITTKAPRNKNIRTIRLDEIPDRVLSLSDNPANETVWQATRDSHKESIHPTQKPVELARRALLNSSRPGEIVVDPFLGSGSTIVAAETTNRACYGIELMPGYCDLIVKRWERQTGAKANRIKGHAPTEHPPVVGKNVAKRPRKGTARKPARRKKQTQPTGSA